MQPILKINLSTGETSEYIIPAEWEQDYLGGASLAARILYAYLTGDLSPYSEESPLLFLVGPLTGTTGPSVGRFVVCGKSPATGLWAESNCGGFWGPELRKTGYDGIWVTGKSKEPVYLWLTDGKLQIRDATGVWGQDTYQLQETIKQDVAQPGARVLGIGIAGEKLVKFAGLFCDHGRTAGRTGLGALMGSKNLKAIAVRGTGMIPVKDADKYNPVRSEANRMLKSDTVAQVAGELGTAGVADYADYLGAMPKKYFHYAAMDGASKVSGATMSETILAGRSACQGCVIACGRVVRLADGNKRKGPEYETVVGLGPNLLIDDLEAITRLMELCDRYGMDTISLSGTLGLAFRLYDLGILTSHDTDGREINWGDSEAAEQLIHWTATRKGIGNLLAEGARSFGAHFGVEDEAVQVNGLEVAYHDPRGVSGMALVYATSPRGACHNQSDYFFVDWGQADLKLNLEFFDRHAGAEKSANVARHQDWRTIYNSLVMCLFAYIPPETVMELVNSACGLDLTLADLMKAGERAWNLKRAINNRLGLTRANDTLPKALLAPYQEGGAAGYVPPLAEMLSAYYAARGWDPVSGKPTRKKLVELNLTEVVGDLWVE